MTRIKKQVLLSLVFMSMFQCFAYSQGSAYSGTYTKSAPVIYQDAHDLTISGLQITNPSGVCISLNNCYNITIQNCKLGPSAEVAVYLYNCKNIIIKNCSMENVASGLLSDTGTGIQFIYNDVKNVMGPMPRGQMAQFDNGYGTGNKINYNICENIVGQNNQEDAVNLFKSNGTAADPIQVIGNWIRGGGTTNSGGGLLAGDNGGSYQLFENNICVNTGNEGIEVAGGHDIIVRNNKFYSQKTAISNVGISVHNQYTDPSYNITIENNQVNWTFFTGEINNLYNYGNSGTITGWSTNVYNPNLNASVLPVKIIGRALQDTIPIKQDTIPASKPAEVNYKIYPNPLYSKSMIVTTQIPNNEKVVIYNSQGLKIIEKSLSNSKTEIDTSILGMGVYNVEIFDNEKVIEQRKITIKSN